MLKKSYKIVYNNNKRKDISKVPISARWGFIIEEEDISDIVYNILGDVLTMEQKERLEKRLEDVNEDERIIKQWMIDDNTRWYIDEVHEDGYLIGKEEGAESNNIEMIKNMLSKQIDYNMISEITGKTAEKIKEIEKSMKEE